MLAILSPAKDMSSEKYLGSIKKEFTQPLFVDEANILMQELKKYSVDELASSMNMSKKLAVLNYERFMKWSAVHDKEQHRSAILSFTGEAYRGLEAASLSDDDLAYSQNVLRILSGLYGVLRPLDLIQPYRLEMGTKIIFAGHKSLYDFWKKKITQVLSEAVHHSPGDSVLLNLASKEYASAIDLKISNFKVINVSFYEEKDETRRMLTVYTKKARGMFARFLIANKIENAEDLKAFDSEGYYFDNRNSSETELIFVR